MNLAVIILTYIVVWCLVLQAVLPFGVKRPDVPGHGHDHGAPEKVHLPIKLIATTVLAALVTVAIYYIAEHDVFNVRGEL